jgi:hypothetical protein
MFGRRFNSSGLLKLGALALAVLFVLFVICAPLATISIKIDLPPTDATPKPMTSADWLFQIAWVVGALLTIGLVVGLVIAAVRLVIRTALKIIRAQPKAES